MTLRRATTFFPPSNSTTRLKRKSERANRKDKKARSWQKGGEKYVGKKGKRWEEEGRNKKKEKGAGYRTPARRSHGSFYCGHWLSATGSLCFSAPSFIPYERERPSPGLSSDGARRQAKDIEFIPGDVASCEMVQTAACGLSVRYKRNMSRKMAVNSSVVRLLFFSFYGFSFNPHRCAVNNVPRDVHFASTLDGTTFIGSIRSRSTTLWCITNVPLGSLGYPYTGT